ncbi:VOC family protein [Altericroceibacterium spongiae]|uniref:VOC family protein n=1 Tax=Altericroceibacterium spongiae TaxID=2320269 RepID=A0A420EPT9_9SPHN|nr:VOC family protein [Altericroceibacterium spongiae]RKF22696.1 VOC family protein [Altericroceibacterium spongiae]
MFRHIVIGADDIEEARRFYDAILAPLGIAEAVTDSKGRLFYSQSGTNFVIGRPIDGQASTYANGGTLGFRAPSADAVDSWHRIGLEQGGTACEDPPGLRISPSTGKELYLAYLRDPTGHKICAVYDASEY